MRKKKLFVLLVITIVTIISVFLLYKVSYKKIINYVALGDSLGAGQDPYGATKGYGYADYLKDYYKDKGQLGNYYNYAVSGYKIDDILKDIDTNIITDQNNQNENIRRALRESDIVTISVGANDLFSAFDIENVEDLDFNQIMLYMKDFLPKLESLLVEIKKYAKNDILVIGYYNPLPSLELYSNEINKLINYVDSAYKGLCNKYDIIYVKISKIFINNPAYLPNPLDIHPSKNGYKAIYEKILEYVGN